MGGKYVYEDNWVIDGRLEQKPQIVLERKVAGNLSKLKKKN